MKFLNKLFGKQCINFRCMGRIEFAEEWKRIRNAFPRISSKSSTNMVPGCCISIFSNKWTPIVDDLASRMDVDILNAVMNGHFDLCQSTIFLVKMYATKVLV